MNMVRQTAVVRNRVTIGVAMATLLVLLLTLSAVPVLAQSGALKIGFSSPLSPPGDYQAGMVNLQTANLAIEHINDAGGVLGQPVSLIIGDDQGGSAAGIQVIRKLIADDQVSAIVGVWHGSVALAQAREADSYGVPLLVHYSWPDEITEMHSDYVFRVSPYNSQIAELLVPFLVQKGYGQVVVMAENSDYGIGFSNALKQLGEQAGINVHVETFPAAATDFQPQLLRVRRMSPEVDLLVVSSVYQAAYLIPRQARELGIQADIMAGWDYPGWSPDWWQITGPHGVGVMYPTFFSKNLELTDRGEAFRRSYTDRFGSEPPIYAYFLYDEMLMIAAAAEQAGSTDPDAIAAALADMSFQGTTGEIQFERREGPGPVWNQWMGQQLFVIQYTEQNQVQDDAPIVYP